MSKFRELRRTYGFDEVAIAPGTVTINPAMTDTTFSVGNISIDIPIIGSAMDAVASPDFASEMHSQGALSVMNLEGVQTRYESAQDAIDEVVNTDNDKVTSVMQKIYSRPIKEEFLLTGSLEPTNEPYAVAKIAGIKMCESYNSQYNTNYICLMPTNTFGPGDNYNLQTSHFIPAILCSKP